MEGKTECENANLESSIPQKLRTEKLVEYDVLRSEVLKRIELRYQSLTLAITAAGIFIAAAARELVQPVALLLYPPLALCITFAWTQNDIRVGQLGEYIRTRLEQQLPGIDWEDWLCERLQEVPYEIYRRFTELTGVGVFIGTEVATVVFAIGLKILGYKATTLQALLQELQADPFFPLVYGILGLLDLGAIGFTFWLLRLRRSEYRTKVRTVQEHVDRIRKENAKKICQVVLDWLLSRDPGQIHAHGLRYCICVKYKGKSFAYIRTRRNHFWINWRDNWNDRRRIRKPDDFTQEIKQQLQETFTEMGGVPSDTNKPTSEEEE